MNLQRAIEIAIDAHKGTYDKAGNLYILHPMRVMLSLETEDEMIVGVLHDVVEDCPPWSFEALAAEGFSETVIEALKSVTKHSDDRDYMAFIERSKSNPVGRKVKVADINDNLNVKRLNEVAPRDAERLSKYLTALKFLKSEPANSAEVASLNLLSIWQRVEEKSVDPLTDFEKNLIKQSREKYPSPE